MLPCDNFGMARRLREYGMRQLKAQAPRFAVFPKKPLCTSTEVLTRRLASLHIARKGLRLVNKETPHERKSAHIKILLQVVEGFASLLFETDHVLAASHTPVAGLCSGARLRKMSIMVTLQLVHVPYKVRATWSSTSRLNGYGAVCNSHYCSRRLS